MDRPTTNTDQLNQPGRGNGQAHLDSADPVRIRAVLAALTQAIAASGNGMDQLCQALCVATAETFGDQCSIQLLNQDDELVHLAGLHDTDPQALALFQEAVKAMVDMPRNQGVAGEVMRTGEPVLLASLPEDALRAIPVAEFQRYIDQAGMSSAMAAPLKGRGGVLGVISLVRHRGRPAYSEDDLRLLVEMTQLMSMAVENGLQVDSLRRQLVAAMTGPKTEAQVAAADQAGQAVRSQAAFDRILEAWQEQGTDVDRMAQEFCRIAAEAIGDMALLALRNPHNEMLHFAGAYDIDAHARSLLTGMLGAAPVMARAGSIAMQVLGNGEPLLRRSISEQELRSYAVPQFVPFMEQVGVESILSIPLKGRNGPLGVLNLYRHKGGKPYNQGDLRFAAEMGLPMQLAIENILLSELPRQPAAGSQENAPAASSRPTYLDLQDPDRLRLFHRLTHIIGENRDKLDRVLELASVMAAESLGGTCQITILNRHDELMHIASYYDADPRARALIGELIRATADMPRDAGMIGRVIQSGKPMLILDVDEAQLRQQALPEVSRFVEEIGISSIIAVPLIGASGALGAISVSRHRGDPGFTDADLTMLNEIAFRLAIPVENRQLITSLQHEIAAGTFTREALDVSEERFRSIFESTTLGIELLDPVGTILDANRAFATMSGYARGELIGRPFGTLQHPEDVVPVLQILTEVRMNRESEAPFENRLVRKDGNTVWVKTNFAAVKKGRGDQGLAFIVAVHEDITGRKRTEQYFQGVLEATPDALVMVDAQGKILLVNRQMEARFQYARHEILGQPIEMLIPERFRDQHPLHRAGYLLDPHVRPMGVGLELFGRRKDGSEFPVEVSLSPLHGSEGPVVVAAIRDITERKNRQAALVRSERTLAEAQRVARLGSLDYDLVAGTVQASDEALRIFGIDRKDFSGSETLRARMHPHDEPRVVERTQAAIQNHAPGELEFRVVHPDGSVHIVHDRVVPFYDEQNKGVRVLGTVQDVTEQREAEKEVAELKSHLQSSAELERLRLAQDLHDGPMQDLYGSSYRLDEIIESAEGELRTSLQEVNEELQQTVSELRSIAKELRPPAISNFGLEKAIRSYVEDFHEKHPNINLHLSLAQDRQLLPENMRLTLFRVLQQALVNVVRHSRASEVRVRFSLDAEEARLEVTDNGTGFRVPPSWMSFVRQGHYGLAGAAERVNALGGILLVESQPEQSTTITAVIPWTPEGGEPEAQGART